MIAGNIQIDDIQLKNKDFFIDLSGALENEKEKDINKINKLLNLSTKI